MQYFLFFIALDCSFFLQCGALFVFFIVAYVQETHFLCRPKFLYMLLVQ